MTRKTEKTARSAEGSIAAAVVLATAFMTIAAVKARTFQRLKALVTV